MVDLVYYLTNLLFFDIWLLYCYVNLNISTIYCRFLEDLNLSFGAFINFSFVCEKFSELFCSESLVILSSKLLPFKILVGSAVLWIYFF